jgi:gallate dioxygenase
MARIIAGIAASHTPTIGFAKDTKTSDDPGWGDVFKVFRPIQDWLEKKQPDVLFLIYNDQAAVRGSIHRSPAMWDWQGTSAVRYTRMSSIFHFFRRSR